MNKRRKLLVTLGAGALAFLAPPGSFGQHQGKVWRVGYLSPSSASLSSQNTGAFLKGLRELCDRRGVSLIAYPVPSGRGLRLALHFGGMKGLK